MDQSIIRISKELSEIQKTSDLSIAVACRDIDVRNVKALIIGPHETPYEFGFFEFAIKFPKDYPSASPNVQCITTNGGRCRFNPNIYASGKVCLSILGTWRGERGEEWSSAQGLESILLSIQSLMSSNPYENEPGYEKIRNPGEADLQKSYCQKICHETLRISVIQRLENYLGVLPPVIDADGNPKPQPTKAVMEEEDEEDDEDLEGTTVPFEPFKDLCKRRFLWYYESYLAAILKGKQACEDGQPFKRMPFESPGNNTMDGKFHYSELEQRLKAIKAALDQETEQWAVEGKEAASKGTTCAVNLQHQFDHVVASLKRSDTPHAVSLEDNNPFVWIITYFGRPMTNFDGGVLRIKMTFSPRFPQDQPRVKFETRIFHHHIAPDGTACYRPNPNKSEDVMSHIEAIFCILEEDEPAYDPRETVHPEATKLYWGGSSTDKKQFNRRLRRSVQDSMEEFPE
ncbi:hypothetical protein NLU13_9242 [Sarocladium strictum]|uniref:Ubiquitin-conjugating enzyme E2 Z n=1 Tax=Sarocladium strictum TaxID=5046 RepID=A0AA39L487_SARSR|nr:hypothetical protein NLU13_9242 [Sarocladium strictum]